jgi:hypothetical protein
MCKRIMALILLSPALVGSQLLAAEDAFSEIPVSERVVSRMPDPKWTPPRAAAAIYQFERPGGLFKKPITGCGSTDIAIHVSAKGSFIEAKVDRPSPFPNFDAAALKYVAKGQGYTAAKLDGKPLDAWMLQRFKFADGDDDECPKPEATADSRSTPRYNAEIYAQIEETKAKNAALQREQQKTLDEQERLRYLTEEPYRKRLPPGIAIERQAMYATELYYNLLHCGDSRYDAERQYFIHEYKGVHFAYKDADLLTKIDRANGYEWRGRITFFCEMTRVHGSSDVAQRGWNDWESCRPQANRVWKRHGKWYVDGFPGGRPRPPLSCATIPPG